MDAQSSSRSQGGLVAGVILIAVGVLFFMDRNDIWRVNIGYVVRTFWPSVMILLGVLQLLEPGRGNFRGAYFLIVFGSIFQLITLRLFDWLRWKNFWPLAMIAAGVWMLIEHFRGPQPSVASSNSSPLPPPHA